MKEAISIITAVILFSVCLFISAKKIGNSFQAVFSQSTQQFSSHTVILDAGHGGEDSGAVASDGTFEKNINLSVCKKIALIFDIFGINYIEIRQDDYSVGNTKLDTIRERKISDIKKRFEIINSTPDAILLSIHQNMFTVEKYHGTQVFYALTDTSDKLADCIQQSVLSSLQQNNKRKIKQCSSSVYLLHKATVPSVMVECGFLSNNEELRLLKTDEYQLQLSYFITKGLINYLLINKEN